MPGAQAVRAPSGGSAAGARADRRPFARGRLASLLAPAALVVAILTAVGLALRLAVAAQSVFADELSTYWIVSTHGLGGVISSVHSNDEITPPLYFVASWLTTRIDLTPELLRAPSLLAGVAAIPVTYLLGLRTVGRPAALVATAITALSPFMIFYSAEARGYGLMMTLSLLSTLALLVALDSGRARWWVGYAVCSCAAVYTHYTVVFALAAQFLWVLWAHPEARKTALLANAGAVVGFLPWTSGLINDLNSPTTKILSTLAPFTLHDSRIAVEHWWVGYPFAFPSTGLGALPGKPALVLLGLGVALGVAGLAAAWFRQRPRRWLTRLDRRLVLVIALALSVPVGEALVSAVSTSVFGVRNLAASWPAFALLLAALLVAAGPRLRFVAAALAIASFAIGAVKMLEPRFQRPDSEGAANFIDHTAKPGDVVLDGVAGVAFRLTPGPFTGLDVALDRPHRVFRVGVPQERTHPFAVPDPVLPIPEAIRQAVAAARGRRLFVLLPKSIAAAGVLKALPPGYRRVEARTYPGILRLTVAVYADRTSSRG